MSPTNERFWSVCVTEGIFQDSDCGLKYRRLLRPIRVAGTVEELTPVFGLIIPAVCTGTG